MGKVMFGLSVSLDGLIAGKNDDVSQVFAWFASSWERFYEVAGDPLNETGAVIMGRRSFDQIYSEKGWVFPDGTSPEWPVICPQPASGLALIHQRSYSRAGHSIASLRAPANSGCGIGLILD